MKQIVLIISLCASIYGHFYTNGFDGALGGEWVTNWRYGMEGLVVDPLLNANSTVWTNGNGKLSLRGSPYEGQALIDTMYNGFWSANTARNTNRYNATGIRPFGFEVIRTYSRINADTTQNQSPKERSQSQLDIWMMEDNGTVNSHRDFYENYMMIYENGMRGPNSAPLNRSIVGYYDGNKTVIDFAQAVSALGATVPLTNTNIHTVNYTYNWQGDDVQLDYTFENGAVGNGSLVGWSYSVGNGSFGRTVTTVNPLSGVYSKVVSNRMAGTNTMWMVLNNLSFLGCTNVRLSFLMSNETTNASSNSAFLVLYQVSNGAPTNLICSLPYNTGTNVTDFALPQEAGLSESFDLIFMMSNSIINEKLFIDNVAFTIEQSAITSNVDASGVENFWIPGPNTPNSNMYGYKMTHDGTNISIYINPDPDDNDAYPNEYFLVAQKRVFWSNNISLMLGHEVMNYWMLYQEADYDSVRIMSAAHACALHVTPTNIAAATNTVTVCVMLSNELHPTNAGVNYVELTKPSDFIYADADASNSIIVSNGVLGVLTNIWIDPGYVLPGSGQAGIRTNGDRITIVLPEIITNDMGGSAAYEHLYVFLRIKMTNSAFTAASFGAAVEARQFDGLAATKGNGSTCGLEHAVQAAALISITKAPAEGFFAVVPEALTEDNFLAGDPQFVFKIKATAEEGHGDIRQAAILVPYLFTNCTFSNFSSSRIGQDITNYVTWFTNIPGLSNTKSSQLIVFTYPPAKVIGSPNGRDEIQFNVYGSATNTTNYSDPALTWTCWLDADAVTSNSFIAATNADYPNQRVLVSAGSNNFWDVYVSQVKDRAPGQAVRGVEVPVASFTVYRDGKIAGTNETVSAVHVTNMSTTNSFFGFFNLYTNTMDADGFTNGVKLSSSNFVSNLSGIVSITNMVISMTNTPENATAVFLTYTPLTFDPLATNRFRIESIIANGPDGGIVGNSNKFTALMPTNIKLEDSTLIATITSISSNKQKQGTNAAVLRMAFRTYDEDASYLMNSIQFSLTSSNISQSDVSVAVYRDNGNVAGAYDSADTMITGSDGVFVSGSKLSSLGSSPVTISRNDTVLYAVVTIGVNATIGGTFSISVPRALQTGFTPAGAVITNDGGNDSSIVCEVTPAVQFAGDTAAVGKTMIHPGRGEKVSIYLDESAADVSQYKAFIYDISGAKVQEISFTSHTATWDGKTIAGQIVRSGMYIAIIKGPNNYSKKIKLMVVK